MRKNQVSRISFPVDIVIFLLLIALSIGGCGKDETQPAATSTVHPSITPINSPPPRGGESPVATTATTEISPPAMKSDNNDARSYPAPLNVTPADSSPVQSADYPAPVQPTPETSRIPIVPFVLDRPLESGATVVRGSGPANVPIVVADIFLMGEVLGHGVIGSDGRFEVTVPPLEKGHWIGIAPDDLSGTEFTYEDFYAQGFRGQGAEQVPQVGFVYDSEYVR